MARTIKKKTKRVNRTPDELMQAQYEKSQARTAAEEDGYLDGLVSPQETKASVPVAAPSAPAGLVPLLLTAEQVCQMLGVSRAHFFRLKKAGSVPPAVSLGGLVRYRREDIEEFVRQLEPSP
ncbi:hypothetical protein GMST_23420 [Geomonas silvestris]|uniref:Helix-turn-helix domain-containing protein n=1 Tax=Geomonas silvestris TaxID=2740184 RepID=A0A6V8MJ84_9BACT|nr:helix-turn-helix domain-containing protein [Geomonas silvestris]GFO60017.1 hypothetical protein GMST_23420 [Geomonas silvestris]